MRREFFNRGGYQYYGSDYSYTDESGNHYDSAGNYVGYTDDNGCMWDECNCYVGRMDEYGNVEDECGEYIGQTDSGNNAYNAAHYRVVEEEEDGYCGSGMKNPTYNSKSGCFLTTACVTYKGLQDDCYELTTLRRFRDEYMANYMKVDVEEYYYIAPKIVGKIDSLAKEEKERCYKEIYDVVKRCCALIEAGDNKSTYILYKKMVHDLSTKFLNKKLINF